MLQRVWPLADLCCSLKPQADSCVLARMQVGPVPYDFEAYEAEHAARRQARLTGLSQPVSVHKPVRPSECISPS